MWELDHKEESMLLDWKRPWCWERLRAGGEGDDRGWDGWMASSTQWTWVWVNSGRWWRTGEPGVLQTRGSQRVRYNWATEQRRRNQNKVAIGNTVGGGVLLRGCVTRHVAGSPRGRREGPCEGHKHLLLPHFTRAHDCLYVSQVCGLPENHRCLIDYQVMQTLIFKHSISVLAKEYRPIQKN